MQIFLYIELMWSYFFKKGKKIKLTSIFLISLMVENKQHSANSFFWHHNKYFSTKIKPEHY